jgi:SAM-dependent methyltransferase
MGSGTVIAEDGPTVEEWEQGLNRRQPPVEIMDVIGIEPGMVIGEVGAGKGRMTVWIAHRVGATGAVFANDIDRDALDHLKQRCRDGGIGNVQVVVGDVDDPKLPAGALDMAFMINVFHHLDEPETLVRKILPSLKPEGVLAIVECDPDKTDWGAGHGCASRLEMGRQLAAAGFDVVRVEDFLNEDSIYVCRPASVTPGSM